MWCGHGTRAVIIFPSPNMPTNHNWRPLYAVAGLFPLSRAGNFCWTCRTRPHPRSPGGAWGGGWGGGGVRVKQRIRRARDPTVQGWKRWSVPASDPSPNSSTTLDQTHNSAAAWLVSPEPEMLIAAGLRARPTLRSPPFRYNRKSAGNRTRDPVILCAWRSGVPRV